MEFGRFMVGGRTTAVHSRIHKVNIGPPVMAVNIATGFGWARKGTYSVDRTASSTRLAFHPNDCRSA